MANNIQEQPDAVSQIETAERRDDEDGAEEQASDIRPVSYTHLTLPTNREV